jgi:hypothetical protein
MKGNRIQARSAAGIGVRRGGWIGRLRWTGALAAMVFAGAMMAAGQQNTQNGQAPNGSQTPSDPGPNRAWTASSQIAIPTPQSGQQNFNAANVERRKQLADDSAKLLKLATDLKAEVDKTDKDTLSLSVIRKAEEIEKLAHSVKEKMKLTAGAN